MTQDFRIRLSIVDDEQTIRRLCITVGESLGFFCLEAEGGDAALALLEDRVDRLLGRRQGRDRHPGRLTPCEAVPDPDLWL